MSTVCSDDQSPAPIVVHVELHPDRQAPVGDDQRPRDVARSPREERDDGRDLVRLGEAPEGTSRRNSAAASASSVSGAAIRVRTIPGATALIRMPWRARSSEAARTKATSAPFVVVYGTVDSSA